jgi:large subunit ribosomal protein L18
VRHARLAGAHSFAASVSGNLRIPLPSVAAPSPTPPARRATLSVVAKVKVSTPQDDRIARHVRLRKNVRNLHESQSSLVLVLLISPY